ncbi:hypothetical protein BC940DRAFT_291534 [Gongronella butleri]|nr:hypothetical protein BC940DRAFT_291534 [Gongronella butleri]
MVDSLAPLMAMAINGSFACFSLRLSTFTAPALANGPRPQHAFPDFFARGARVARFHITAGVLVNGLAYYRSKDTRYLWAAGLTATVPPITTALMMPINRRLFALAAESLNTAPSVACRANALGKHLMQQWMARQWARTLVTTAAFAVHFL